MPNKCATKLKNIRISLLNKLRGKVDDGTIQTITDMFQVYEDRETTREKNHSKRLRDRTREAIRRSLDRGGFVSKITRYSSGYHIIVPRGFDMEGFHLRDLIVNLKEVFHEEEE